MMSVFGCEQKCNAGARQITSGSRTDILAMLADLKECSKKRSLEWGKQVHAEAVECGCNSNIYVANALINMYAKCGDMQDARQVFESLKHPTVVSWTTLILGYADNGQGCVALDLYTRMKSEGPPPNSVTFVAALKACSSVAVKEGTSRWAESREIGRMIHNFDVKNGFNVYVLNTLIDMYAKCGSMFDARQVFDSMKRPDAVSWNVLISGYADNGQSHTALELFTWMKLKGPPPSSVTFVAALKACSSLAVKEGSNECAECGREIHNLSVENGCNSDVCVRNTLLVMYAKFGNMLEAQEIFDSLKNPDVVSWTTLISGYVDNEQAHSALNLFNKMRAEGPAPDSVTVVAAIKACTSRAIKGGVSWAKCRELGKEIHNFAAYNGCSSDLCVQSTLVDMYAKCGSMVDALEVFDSMTHPDVVSWTALILGYADNGQWEAAMDLFARMRTEGPAPNSVTIVAALKACTSFAVKEGAGRWPECRNRCKEIHNFAVKNGCSSNAYVQSTLVDMYVKCGCMGDARSVFDNMKNPDVVSWSVLILGYADSGQGHTALELFTKMRSEGHVPDSITFGAVIKACGLVGALEFGRTIHSEINSGKDFDVVLVTCLVDFYAKCGSLEEAKSVFDLHTEKRDMITWTAMLAGFSSCGVSEPVFSLFEEMQQAGFKPDGVTFLCILTCCSHAGLVEKGKEYFNTMFTKYGLRPTLDHYNCMVDIFGRANKLDEAVILLGCMSCSANDVTWMTVLGACRKWENVEIGRLAFKSLSDLTDGLVSAYLLSAYLLMGQIYGSRGMLQEQERVLQNRKKLEAWKKAGQTCWTNEMGVVHRFMVEDKDQHPQIHEIHDRWTFIGVMLREHGYVLAPLDTTDAEKEESVCGHSERLALVCALINTKPKKTIRILKNMRVCDDCHTSIALISRMESRTIICKDAIKIHIFKHGKCSCGD